jgi:hypothetical protein
MIMTIEEARDILRVDGTDLDPMIYPLLEAIPSYLESTTGKAWDDPTPIHPLAKQAATFILQLWFEPQDANTDRLKKTIDGLLTALQAIGRGA